MSTWDSYGTISLAFVQGNLSDIPDPGTLWYSDDVSVFCDQNSIFCSYVFHETNPESLRNPDAIPVVATTNRIVNASSQCSSFPVIRGGDGTDDTIGLSQSGKTANLTLPVRGGLDQSTFIANTSSSSRCGPNCGIVSAFEASPSSAWYYNCTTTLSQVSNAALPEHDLGPDLTRLATTAIALQGYSSGAAETGETQFQIYPSESVFGVPLNGSANDMAFLLSRFAIGVVAVTAEANADVTVGGRTPHIGQKLNVQHWNVVHIILGLTAGLQLLFAVAATWVSRRVVIPSGGSIAEAQVLRSMIGNNYDGSQGPRNEAWNEKNTSRPEVQKGDCWIFRDHHVGDGIYDLHMERIPPSRSVMEGAGNPPDSGMRLTREGREEGLPLTGGRIHVRSQDGQSDPQKNSARRILR